MSLSLVFSFHEFTLITQRLAQFYISNDDPISFLQTLNYHIHLEDYVCVCYGGNTDDSLKCRKVEFFRFVGVPDGDQGYVIQQYKLPEETPPDSFVELSPLPILPIHDCHFLRRHIFQYTDKTSLFRSTLFYVPSLQQMFRIQGVLPFLSLPILHPTSFSPTYHRKFLVLLNKKKQFLKKLEIKKELCEKSILIHGLME